MPARSASRNIMVCRPTRKLCVTSFESLMTSIAGNLPRLARNPKALKRLVAAGAQLVVLNPDILKALHTALEQVLDEEAAKSEQFKRVLENWRAFRAEQHRWFLIADARTEMSVYTLTTAQ